MDRVAWKAPISHRPKRTELITCCYQCEQCSGHTVCKPSKLPNATPRVSTQKPPLPSAGLAGFQPLAIVYTTTTSSQKPMQANTTKNPPGRRSVRPVVFHSFGLRPFQDQGVCVWWTCPQTTRPKGPPRFPPTVAYTKRANFRKVSVLPMRSVVPGKCTQPDQR